MTTYATVMEDAALLMEVAHVNPVLFARLPEVGWRRVIFKFSKLESGRTAVRMHAIAPAPRLITVDPAGCSIDGIPEGTTLDLSLIAGTTWHRDTDAELQPSQEEQ